MPAWRKLHRNWLRKADQSHVVSHPAAVEYDFRRDIVAAQQFRISNFNKGTVNHASNDQSTDDSAANLDLDHASLYKRQYPRQHRPQWLFATLRAALG
jgi:hypothetical protein